MIQTWKTRLLSILLIALAVSVLVGWLAPGAIAWYFNPPVDVGVNCTNAVIWGMKRLQTSELIGLIAGFVIGVVVTFMLSRGGSDDRAIEKETF